MLCLLPAQNYIEEVVVKKTMAREFINVLYTMENSRKNDKKRKLLIEKRGRYQCY